MTTNVDRLYELLPSVYRIRDAESGYALKALLRVIGEQVNLVEEDIRRLYDNWFIETADSWAVPYIGDLLGYRPVHEGAAAATTAQGLALSRVLVPRREVANLIHFRRRKGTLAVLEELAQAVAGWPCHAVEFYRLLGWTQALNHQEPRYARTVDIRSPEVMQGLNGPFDVQAHTVDVRRISGRPSLARHNLPNVGLFVWRLRSYSVTTAPAELLEETGARAYSFSALGNNTPLFVAPPTADEVLTPLTAPAPISRLSLEKHRDILYGSGKSLSVWVNDELVAPERIVAADLSDWRYRPHDEQVAIDPETGRLAFPLEPYLQRRSVRVSYHYGFGADIGGGEYERPLIQPQTFEFIPVLGADELRFALEKWSEADPAAYAQQPQQAVIELGDSDVYSLPLNLRLKAGHSLQIRAAQRTRPVIRLLDWHLNQPDSLFVRLGQGSRLTLDGLLVSGRPIELQSDGDDGGPDDCPAQVTLRHCTLVPGWDLSPNCEPQRPNEPSLLVYNLRSEISIEHSIVGTVLVAHDVRAKEPIKVSIMDSILDATSEDRVAFGSRVTPVDPEAHVSLTIKRSTVFGIVNVHSIELAEDSIFAGCVNVERRQTGCMRFCYVDVKCQTPKRYNCQPDLARQVAADNAVPAEREAARVLAGQRVKPRFLSDRYGTPDYARLSEACALEIRAGADDESEMGVYHDLFQPQRLGNLYTRLEEYTPAGTSAGVILVN